MIEGYLLNNLDGALGVPGVPDGQLVVNPHQGTLSIRFPADGRLPDVVDRENVVAQLVNDHGVMWHQLSVRIDDNVEEVYAFLCAILDRVQLSGEAFADGVDEALESLTGILAVRRGLTREKQVGLFGELVVFGGLVASTSAGNAIGAWRGPSGEEHDFGLSMEDVEVKTTLSERRQHWISSATQMMPTRDRPLYLVSIQLTSSPVMGGLSLPALVDLLRVSCAERATQFDAIIHRLGYRVRDADLYRSRWSLRSQPAFFAVDNGFPSLTQLDIDRVVPSSERIIDMRYRVDLTGLAVALPLFAIGDPSDLGVE